MTPTTKAGRALLEYLDVAARETYMPFDRIRPLILAIEREAAAEAEALRAALTVERLADAIVKAGLHYRVAEAKTSAERILAALATPAPAAPAEPER